MKKSRVVLFIDHVRRVSLLDANVYQVIGKSFVSAVIIVLLVGLSHGLGGVIRANFNQWNALESFIVGLQGEILFWFTQSLLYYAAARWLLNKQVPLMEVLTVIGYAIFPGVLVIIAVLLEPAALTIPFLILIAIYRLITCTLALKQLLLVKLHTAILLAICGTAFSFFSLGFGIRLTEAILK